MINPMFGSGDESEVKQRLMEAAARLFAENGYAATPVREIVREAGVTKPVLYYHFNNKDGLYRSLVDEARRDMEEFLDETDQAAGTAREKFYDLFKSSMERTRSSRDLVRMVLAAMFGPNSSTPDISIDLFDNRTMETIRNIYLDGVQNGELSDIDSDTPALIIMAVLVFSIACELAGVDANMDEISMDMLQVVLKGLRREDIKNEAII